MRKLIITTMVVFLTFYLHAIGFSAPQTTSSSNIATVGNWAGNGTIAVKVDKVEEVNTFEGLGDLQRAGPDEVKALKNWTKIDGKTNKFIVVYASIKNLTKGKLQIGYLARPWTSGGIYPALLLIGEEGTMIGAESGTGNPNKGMGYYVKGSMPLNSDEPSGGTIKGKIVYIVPVWFVPVKLSYPGKFKNMTTWGNQEVIVKLK